VEEKVLAIFSGDETETSFLDEPLYLPFQALHLLHLGRVNHYCFKVNRLAGTVAWLSANKYLFCYPLTNRANCKYQSDELFSDQRLEFQKKNINK